MSSFSTCPPPSASTVVLSLVLMAVLTMPGCDSSDLDDSRRSGPGTIPTSGSVEAPGASRAAAAGVMSGLNTGTLSPDGYAIDLNENAVQLVAVVDASDVPLMLSVRAIRSEADSVPITSTSTAEALLLLHPFYAPSDVDEAEALLGVIRGLDTFSALASTIETALASGAFTVRRPGVRVREALAVSYAELRRVLETQYADDEPTPTNRPPTLTGPTPDESTGGVRIVDVEETPGSFSFRVENTLRRWIGVYVDPADGGAPATEPVALVPSTDVSVFARATGAAPTAVTSSAVTVGTSGASQIAVTGYGPGVSYPDDTEVHFDRFLLPAVASTVFDGVLPLVEIVTGLDDLDAALRDALTQHPFYPLVEQEAAAIAADATMRGRLLGRWRNGDPVNVVVDLTKRLFQRLADDPQGLADRLAAAGVEPSTAASVQSWLWPLVLTTDVVTDRHLGFALGALLSTEARSTFTFDVDDAPLGTVELTGTVAVLLQDAGGSAPTPIADVALTAFDESDVQRGFARTTSNGRYLIPLDNGTYRIRAVADGYVSTDLRVVVASARGTSQEAPGLWMAPPSTAFGTIEGRIRDATSQSTLGGVRVELRRGAYDPVGPIVRTALTSGDGTYRFDGLSAGTYTAFASSPAFVTSTVLAPAYGGETRSGYDATLSPTLESGFRIVVEWGAEPRDLDSHLYTPDVNGQRYHVYYARRGASDAAPFAFLDVDDTTSFGPETITITQPVAGSYAYSVYNFSGSPDLSTSQARVRLFGTSGRIREWMVPQTGAGRWWNVFTLDGDTGFVTSIDALADAPTGFVTTGERITSRQTVAPPPMPPKSNR